MLSRTLTPSLLACLLLGACAPATDPEPESPAADVRSLDGFEAAAATISAEDIEAHVRALASDEMQGRAPGTPGDEMARAYLIEQMQALGFEPAGTDGWEQPFDIVAVNATLPDQWSFSSESGSVELDRGTEYIANSGVQEAEAVLDSSELVFVGYGMQAPEYEWDDFKGVDLAGKTLVMLNNDPDWDEALFAGETRLYYGRWRYKYESAARQGAAGAIIIHTTPSAGYGWNVVQTSWSGDQIELPATGAPRATVEGWVTEDAAKEIFALAGVDYDAALESARSREFEPMPLGVTTSLRLENTVEATKTANVLGILRGSGDNADEVIALSAHFDHLGAQGGDPEDPIYNGALDNAAGCAQVLAIAKAIAALPEAPSRSILLAFVAAEESGLLGSAYFAANPTVEPGRIAANVNYDGANIWGSTRDVTFIGHGKSSLDAVVEAGAALQDRVVKPDQFPDRGFYYRSDQFSFAKIGVPAVYLDTGTDFEGRDAGWGSEQIEAWEAEHYHQPSDEIVDSWNYDGISEDVWLGLYVTLTISETEELPTWTPGDEFEAARLDALAAVDG